MKGRRGISISFLFVSCSIVLCLCGCSNNYRAERLYWQVQNEHAEALQNPAGVSVMEYSATVRKLKEIVEKCPGWRSGASVQFVIAEGYFTRREYKRAQSEFKTVIEFYPEKAELSARSLFMIAQCYESQGQEESALGVYERIMQRYMSTQTGMKIPMYIAQRLRTKHYDAACERAFEKARERYEELRAVNPYGKVAAAAEQCIIDTFLLQNKWRDAASYIDNVLLRTENREREAVLRLALARLYEEKLKETEKAFTLYEKLSAGCVSEELRRTVELEKAKLLVRWGKSSAAREVLARAVEKYQGDAPFCVQAGVVLAQSYEAESRWKDAMGTYLRVIAKYPRAPEAMMIPFLIQKQYFSPETGSEQKACIDACAVMLGRMPDSYGMMFHAKAMVLRGRWSEAHALLVKAAARATGSGEAADAFFMKALVQEYGLKDKKRSIKTYYAFLKRYPQEASAPFVRYKLQKVRGMNAF